MKTPPTVRVTAGDTRAAERLIGEHDDHTGLLYGDAPGFPQAADFPPRHRGAVATALLWPPGRFGQVDQSVLLSVIRATARAHNPGTAQFLMDTGVVMLGGEIAARYLYRRLVRARGALGFEPVASVIARLWPLPEETAPPTPGYPPMDLRRLTTGPLGAVLHERDTDALRGLAVMNEFPLQGAVRLCYAVTGDRDRLDDDLAAVRDAVLISRSTGRTVPWLIPEAS